MLRTFPIILGASNIEIKIIKTNKAIQEYNSTIKKTVVIGFFSIKCVVIFTCEESSTEPTCLSCLSVHRVGPSSVA